MTIPNTNSKPLDQRGPTTGPRTEFYGPFSLLIVVWMLHKVILIRTHMSHNILTIIRQYYWR